MTSWVQHVNLSQAGAKERGMSVPCEPVCRLWPLQWLDVAPLAGEFAERSSQASSRFRWKPPYEIDDLLGKLDLHRSSRAESGRKRIFPAR